RNGFFAQPPAALVAVGRPEMVLVPAMRAVRGELAARHGNKRAVAPVDDLQVANDEAVVEGNRTERLQAIVRVLHQFDPHFGDFHTRSPWTKRRAWPPHDGG